MNKQKKFRMFVAVGIFAFFGNADYSLAAENLITNPSVETRDGAFPDGWAREKSGNNVSVFSNSASGYDGDYGLEIVVKKYVSGYSGWYFNPIDADSGAAYQYIEYYKASMPTDLFARITSAGGQVSTVAVLSNIDSSSDWRRLDVEFSVPSNASSFTMIHRTRSNGTLSVDNFSLTKKDGAAPVVDVTPPTVSITNPTTGMTISGTRDFSANAADAVGVVGVQFMIDGAPFGSEKTASPYAVSFDTTTLSDGSHTVSARARDLAGNTTLSSIISFTVNNAPVPLPPVSDGNIVPNASLESVSPTNKNLPLSWKKTKTGNNNAVFSYLNTGFTGSRSLQVKISKHTSGVAYYSFDPQPVVGGKVYEYSLKYKSDTYAEADVEITLVDGTVRYEYLGVMYPSPAGWSDFSVRLAVPENAKSVKVYSLLYSVGSLVTDDYSFSPVTIVPLKNPIVTITFDDFFTSFYDNAFPIFKKYGMAGTMYLVSSDLDKPEMMTKAQLREIQSYGFEIGSHSVSHPHFPMISPDQMDSELRNSKETLAQYMEADIESFATPYGEYNSQVIPHIEKFYSSHRSVDAGYNTKDNFNQYNIRAMSANSATSPETVLGWVDEAIRNRANLSLVYHDIIDNGTLWSNTPAHLETVLAGLNARGVRVLTTKQALAEILPQMR